MRLAIYAAVERSASSSLDAAMLDGAALAAALQREGHTVELGSFPAPGPGLASRAIAAAQVAKLVARLALQRPPPDAVLMVAPPNLPSLLVDSVAAARGIPGVVVVTAMTTEARLRTGELAKGSVDARVMAAVEAAVMRRSRVLVVPSEPLRRRALLKGAFPGAVQIVRELLVPLVPPPPTPQVRRLRTQLAQGAECLAVLAAPLGAATDLSALVGALTRLRDEQAFAFAAVSGGSRAETLKQMLAARGIKNAQVTRLARQDRRAAVHAADVLVGIAVPAHDGLCVPRAVSRALWAGKPLVAVGPPGSDLVADVRRLGVGPCLEPGDDEGLAAALRALVHDVGHRRALGARAAAAGAAMCSPLPALLESLAVSRPLHLDLADDALG